MVIWCCGRSEAKQAGLAADETNDNVGGQKKTGLLGKIKDKTKNVGTKIKSKVGGKKNTDGNAATSPTTAGGDDDEDDEEDAGDVS